METGIDYLKKITDLDTGLENHMETLEEVVLKTGTGLEDRVKDLETAVNHPATGLVAATDPTPQSSSIDSAQYHRLTQWVTDLENKFAKSQFEMQVLLSWADNMYKDHQSLQKQVNFHDAKHHSNELIVGGVYEGIPDVKKAVQKFMEEKLGVKPNPGDVYHARRIGKEGRVIEVESENEEGALEVR